MKTLAISLLLASTAFLTGCVEDGGYRGDPGYRAGGPYVSERWRNDRNYDRDRGPSYQGDRTRDRGDWRRDRNDDRNRADWRDRNRDNRPVQLDQYGRPVIYRDR